MVNNVSSSIKKNLGLQTLFQILNTCLPLITAPYLSRVLGASSLGVYSFTSSVVLYFTLFAMLGTVNYGTRTIATAKNNKDIRSKCFWSIFYFQIFVTCLCFVLYVLYMLFVCQDNYLIAWLQGISIICCFFDINWLFFGVENFKITVTRSIFIKIISVALILIMVKKTNDLWIYTLIMAMSTFMSQLVLWFYLPQYVSFCKVTFNDIYENIKPNIVLFIPLLAMSVYHIMDKTMLGLLSSYAQTGFYYNSDKLINIPLCVINGVGTVMLPRMSALFTSNNKDEAKNVFKISLEGIGLISIAMAFGIAAIANEFIPFFFGEGYEACILLTIVLSPVLIIKGFTNTIRTQYLVPLKMERYYINSVLSGAITNLILNMLLIPKLGAMGAVLGTLFAELVACIVQFRIIRNELDLRDFFINCFIYLCMGLVMFILIRLISNIQICLIGKIIIEILLGGVMFITTTSLYIYKTKSKIYNELFVGFLIKIPYIRKFINKSI